jgi:acyl-coenzyme A thioesterase PaaI-like protein
LSAKKDDERIPLPKIDGYRCFACGVANPVGLRMAFYCQGKTVCSDLVLHDNHAGWENMAHGGIIATVLDEVMGWTVIALRRRFFVTRSMEIRYLRQVPVGEPVTAVGELETPCRSRECRVKGVLVDGRGIPLAESRAQMVLLPPQKLVRMPEHSIEVMERLFAELEQLLG